MTTSYACGSSFSPEEDMTSSTWHLLALKKTWHMISYPMHVVHLSALKKTHNIFDMLCMLFTFQFWRKHDLSEIWCTWLSFPFWTLTCNNTSPLVHTHCDADTHTTIWTHQADCLGHFDLCLSTYPLNTHIQSCLGHFDWCHSSTLVHTQSCQPSTRLEARNEI